MQLMSPTAAFLVVLTRPAAAGPPRNEIQQAAPKDTTKKKKDDKKDAKKPKTEYPFFRLDDHPSIHFGKGTHLDFRARFAADVDDSDAPTDDPVETSNVDLGKKRIGVSGEIKNAVEFQVEAELSHDDPWRDVYADFKKYDAVRVRGGKFKIPFSLDENTGASKLDFMFRRCGDAPRARARSRRPGPRQAAQKVLGYEAGVFEHDGKNARTNNPDKCSAVRLRRPVLVEPLANRKDAIGDLSFGAAFTQSDVRRHTGLRGRPCSIRRSSRPPTTSERPAPPARSRCSSGRAGVDQGRMDAGETQRRGESVGGHRSVAPHR